MSGTSTAFHDKRLTLEFHKDSVGQGSRLGSGSVTPNGAGQASRPGYGTVTPDGLRSDSRLGSSSLTPDGAWPTTQGNICVTNQISEKASLAKSENGHQSNATLVSQSFI
ncbi:unnamed protein product [Lupinus luteus]|uniref:Uncharacterized protein n=1 Tax=Lupinus luteus TaxID=3873 RepID=A0AAV1Y6D7_LUPLU